MILLYWNVRISCADKLTTMSHGIQGSIWLDTLPADRQLHMDIFVIELVF